ncbi:MAG: DUF2470 domain-containing protein [Microbacterium sp.]|nr:DUF2470 domain-containing protein [Microbacterium sp.]
MIYVPESKAHILKDIIRDRRSRETYSDQVPHFFESDVVAAILHHMNDDHADDNLLIARAFATASDLEITHAVMTDLDGDGGVWQITRAGLPEELRVPWPGGEISERPAVRREVVALYDAACEKLGIEPRPHA